LRQGSSSTERVNNTESICIFPFILSFVSSPPLFSSSSGHLSEETYQWEHKRAKKKKEEKKRKRKKTTKNVSEQIMWYYDLQSQRL